MDTLNYNFTDRSIKFNLDESESNSALGLVPTLRTSDEMSTRTSSSRSSSTIGYRKVDQDGIVTYKNIKTTQIMNSLQLSIGCDIGRVDEKTLPNRDLLLCDFQISKTINFPKLGSDSTPCHHFSDFIYTSYSPNAFRHFRELYKILPEDYLLSISNGHFIELKNPGNSGSIFYKTYDDLIIFKTAKHKETRFLQRILPGYFLNLFQNPKTLLPKFFGLYCYKSSIANIRLIAMNNLIPTTMPLHEKFDIKGSTYNRMANKKELLKDVPTYKDLDFKRLHPKGIFLDPRIYDELFDILKRDCRVLESFNIMDYSLLLGIHNLERRTVSEVSFKKLSPLFRTRSLPGVDSLQLENEEVRVTEKTKASSALNINSIFYDKSFISKWQKDNKIKAPLGAIPARSANGDRLLLFWGIIDVLQNYEFLKKLEYSVKSLFIDKHAISVQRPDLYSKRFQEFIMTKVFIRSNRHNIYKLGSRTSKQSS